MIKIHDIIEEAEAARAIDTLKAERDRYKAALEFIRDNTDETFANNVAFKALGGNDESN